MENKYYPWEIDSGVWISEEASYLFSDQELVSLLRRRGVDTTRPTRIKKTGRVVYLVDSYHNL